MPEHTIGTLVRMKPSDELTSMNCSHVLSCVSDANTYGREVGLIVGKFVEYYEVYFPSTGKAIKAIQSDQFDVIGNAFDRIER